MEKKILFQILKNEDIENLEHEEMKEGIEDD